MRKLIVSEWMTLDGVVQSPTSPTEDPDGSFRAGGWHSRHFGDPMFQQSMVEVIQGAGAYLFGRRTYENLAAYWPTAPKEEAAIADPLNSRPKYVVSTTLGKVLPWQNSTLIRRAVPEAVAALRRTPGDYLLVMGSAQLVRTLLEHDLVDELRFMIDPVVVGGGKRIFLEDGKLRKLDLVASTPTPTGALLATYVPAAA